MKTYGYNHEYNILVMELLGPSLETLFRTNYNDNFSLKTVCMIGIQILDRIEYIHSRKIIHRDIKPDNFVIGEEDKSHIIYILDFGLAKKYWSSSKKCHIPFIEGKQLTGTARYASINALSGCEQSRRDDLESIAYMLIYFLKGRLPWQGLKVANKEERYSKILEKKKSISIKELCTGAPREMETFVSYVKNLEFTEVPNYDYLRQLLKNMISKIKETIDFFYDWEKEKPNIDKNNIIYKNNYHIEYNGKNEWLIRNKNNNYYQYSNRKSTEKVKIVKNVNNIYSKPAFAVNQAPSFKNNYKSIKIININVQHLKTASNSYNGSRVYETNYTSSRNNVYK